MTKVRHRSRKATIEGVDSALDWQNLKCSEEQRIAIVAYAIAHDAPIFHAIARVLGTCCHCVDCLNKAKLLS